METQVPNSSWMSATMSDMNARRRPFLLVGVGFAAGVAVGAIALDRLFPADAARVTSQPDSIGNASTEDHARPAAATTRSDDGMSGELPLADPASPTLAAPPSLPEGQSIRRLVAASAREILGSDLPDDYLDEAVRLARQGIAYQPKAQAQLFARREKMRRRLGELGTPWEIVIQIRSSSSKSFDLGLLEEERRGTKLSATPLDVDRPVGEHASEDTVYVRSGVVPAGQLAVLESVEVRGQFGTATQAFGRVEFNFGNGVGTEVRGKGATRVRFAGSRRPWSFTGFGGGDARVAVEAAAAEVIFRGTWSPQDGAVSAVEKPFGVVSAEGAGFILPGSIRLQVLADHGGGNPHSAYLDGTHNGYIRGVAARAIWDDAGELKKASQSSMFASGTGVVPPGKALRVRRVEWRARFGEIDTHSVFAVRVAGSEIVALKGSDILSSDERREREKAGSLIEESRSGTWTGELLVRAGEETRTSITCSYYVLGEAVFDAELIDEPK